MKKMFTSLCQKNVFILLTILLSTLSANVKFAIAQTITTPYTGSFTFFAAPANIAFVVENTNGSDIIITDVGHYCELAENNSVWQLYYSATSLSGDGTPVPGSEWTLIATSAPVAVASNGIVPVFSGLSFNIPANTQYRFVMKNTGPGSTRYVLTPTPNLNLFSDAGVNLKVGNVQINSLNVGYSGAGTALSTTPRYWHGSIGFMFALPCVDPPTPGSSTASALSVCQGGSVTLNLTGHSIGLGQTYQWESGPTGTGPFTSISGVQASPSFTINPATTAFYRCAVTCGSTTLFSTPVEVIAISGLSGIFTIDNTLPTGGSNFESFTDAVNALFCGITGPVTFNVTAGQSFIENVPMITVNSNSVNTFTFQRSGAGPNPVIVPTGTTAVTDAGITINGSDYITFDGIDIIASGTAVENGYRIQSVTATNGAQNNTIKNCKITLNRTNTASRGIFQTNAFTPTNLDGGNSHNTYMNLEIYNVYAGIQLAGLANATFPDRNNKIITANCSEMNIIGDPLTPFDIGGGFSAIQTWGIRLTNQAGFTVSNNRISNISGNTTTDGVFVETYIGVAGFLESTLSNNIINGVRINTSVTTQVTGIRLFHSTLAVPSGTILKVYNNSISNITSAYSGAVSAPATTTGIKGISIAGTGGSTVNQTYEIVNNSVSIDGSGSPNLSNMCFQISATAGTGPINIVRNNVFANFTVAQIGTPRHLGVFTASVGGATALGPAGSAFTNNDIWIANDVNVSGFTARGSTTHYNGIAAFQATYTQATANIEVNPMFISNNSNLHATNLGLDGSGFAYPAYLAVDLDCAPRTSPSDIGAYNVAPCAGTPPTASITGSLCNGGTLTAVTNASLPNYQWLLDGSPVGSNSSTLITNVTGSYSVSIWESGTLCISTSSAVTVAPGVSINPTASPALICDGESSQLSANGAVSGVFSYGITNLVGQTYTTLTGPGITVINDASQLTPGFSSADQDDGGVLVSLPFAFNYFGNSFTQASFSTNGWVSMGATYSTIAAGPDRTPGNLFITTAPNNTLAPWFKDMGANFGAGFPGTMRHGIIGTDVYAFQWDQAVGSSFSNTTTILVSFQVNIYGPGSSNPGRIEFIYGPTLGAIAFAAAVGIEDAVGGTGRFLNALNGSTSSTLLSTAWPGNGNGFAFEPFSLTYSWSPAGTLSNSTIANPLATPGIGTTIYSVTATNSFGCSANGTVSVTNLGSANPAPTSSGSSACAGESVILSATGIGTIKWYNALTGGTLLHTGASFTVSPTQTTTYYAADDNGTCESDRVAVMITVNPVPIVNPTSSPSTICDGGSSQLGANAFQFSGMAYGLTSLSGQTYSPLTGPGITIITQASQLTTGMGSTNQDDGGVVINIPFSFNYMGNVFTQMSMCTNGWVGAGNHGTIDAVNMRLAGNLFTSTIPNNTLAAWFKDLGANFGTGFPGTMRHGLIGTDKYAFQWDQAVGTGFSNTTANLISFQINIYGPASTDPGRIEYIYGPQVGLFAADASVGIEDAVGGANHFLNALNGSSTSSALSTAWPGNGNGFVFDPSPVSLLWSPAGSLNDASISNPLASPSVGTTVYTVTATNSFGCTASGTVSVTVIASPPAPTATALNTVCGVDQVTLSSTGTGNPGTVINWYDVPTGGSSIGSGNTIIVTINTTTTFYATEFDGTCEGPRAAVNAVSTPAPAILLTTTLNAICDGSTTPAVLTTTSPNDPNYSYAYTPTTGLTPANGLGAMVSALPSTSTTYTVTATDGVSGCVNTATIFIGVGTTPIFASASASPSSFCTGESSTLNAAANITGGTIDPEPTGYCAPIIFNNPGATGDFISNVTFNTLNNSTGDGPGDYNYYPPVGAQTTTVTAGNTYPLTVTTDPGWSQGKAVFIDWNRNGIFESSEMVLAGASSNAPESAQVTVPVSVSSGMTRMRVVCVFSAAPLASWACEPTAVGFGEVEDYTILIEGGGSTEIIYTWSPATGLNTTTGQTVIATPIIGGSHIYTVTASHEGCMATATVTVNANQTPPAPIAIDGTRCGLGQVTIGATGTGGTLIWTEMEAGSIVNTGTTYSPLVSSSGSLHVLEYPALDPAQNVGFDGTVQTPVGYFPTTAQWQPFNVLDAQGIIINTVEIFANGPVGAPFTIALQDLSDNTYATVSGVTTFQNTAGTLPINPQTVTLNFFVPQGSWKLRPIVNPNFAVHQLGSVSTPYTIPGVISILGYGDAAVPVFSSTYGFFYNWSISTACFGPQAVIDYNLTTPPPLSITAVGPTSYCDMGSVVLTAGGDPSWTIFTWSPGDGLNTTNGSTVIASPTETTTYTVLAADANSIAGCANTATVTVTVNESPSAQVLPIIDPICINSSVQLTAIGASNSYKRIGLTEDPGLVSGGIFNGANFAQRSQMIFTAAELNAAGLFGPGFITGIGFQASGKLSTQPYTNFTVSIANTALSAFAVTTYENPAFTTVYQNNYTSVLGWNDIMFTTPYLWDGVSNILVQSCFTNATTSFFDMVYTSNAGANRFNSLNAAACNAAAGTLAVNRPNVRFTGGMVNFSWNPATDLSVTNIFNPVYSASSLGLKTYTVTVSDPASSCTATASLSFTVSDTPTTPVATITGDSEFCQSGSTSIVMTGSTGSIQWESSNDGMSWSNISGANTATFNTGVLTTTTYFQVITSCGNSSTSNVVVVTVNNPQIATSMGATRCGTGEVCISATTVDPNHNVQWFDTPTGGTSLATGNTFCPTVSSNTTYYAEPSIGGGGLTSLGAPDLSIGTFGAWSATAQWLNFTVFDNVSIQSVDMFFSATLGSAFSIVIRDATTLANVFTHNDVVTVSGGSITPQTVVINASLSPGNYQMNIGSTIGTFRNDAGAVYPYTIPNLISITGNTFDPNYYYMFYNWQIITGCVGPRVPVPVIVTPAPAVSINPSSTTIMCGGNPFTLTASSSNDPNYIYTWQPGNLTGSSISVSPYTTTTYTVSATDGNCNSDPVSYTITVLPTPALPVLTASASQICEGDMVTLSVENPSNEIISGSGLVTVGIQGTTLQGGSPYRAGGGAAMRTQYIYSASELTTAGLSSGNALSSIAFNLTTLSAGTLPGYTIRIGHTNASAVTATFLLDPTIVVFGPTNVNMDLVPLGYTTWSFSNNFTWDGVSNILIEVCHDNPSPTGGSGFVAAIAGAGLHSQAINAAGCSALSGTIGTDKPVLQLGYTGVSVPATYIWQPGNLSGTSVLVNPSVTTSYTVTASFTNGCTATNSIIINVDPIPVPIIASTQSMPLCEGETTVLSTQYSSANGYTFSWNGGLFTSESITVDVAGTYDCVVTSPNGCTSTLVTFEVSISTIFADILSVTDALCFGSSDGTVELDVLGAILEPQFIIYFGPFDYAVDGGALQSSPLFTGLAAGTYTFEVHDPTTGCVLYIPTTVNEPPMLVAGPVTINNNVSCNGLSDGSATAGASGGTGPYTYSWNTPIPKQGELNDEIPSGIWTVTVTDANGCTATVEVTITEPDVLVASVASQTNVSCNGGTDGSVTITATGGTAPYTGDGVHSDLSAGTYEFIVTDINGCADTVYVIITEPIEVTVSASSTNVSCYGLADGTITVNAPAGATVTIDGQAPASTYGPGTYTVVASVPDGNGVGTCSASTTVTITEPIEVTLSATSTHVTCNGFANGTITATASLGATITVDGQPYNPSTNYGPGTYTVMASADNGNNDGYCTATTTVTITQPDPLTVSVATSNSTYWNANDGTVAATPSGGTPNYTYLWSNGPTASSINSLAPGEYTVTVTDANGCTVSATVIITEPGFVCSGSSTHVKWGQGGWGGTPNGTNPATYLYANFAAAFPNGLTIGHPTGTPGGCNRSMKWTTHQAITAFLPSTGTPRQLNTGHSTNLTAAQYGNTFASQVVALTLNVVFDAYDPNFSPGSTVTFGDMIVCINGNNTQFNGWTVKQLLAEGNRVLACGGNKNYISALSNAIDAVSNTNNATCCPSAPAARVVLPDPTGQKLSLNVYPNPTNGKVTLNYRGGDQEITEIVVMDMRGRVVSVEKIASSAELTIEIDLGTIENGLYFISVMCKGELIKSSKVSKIN